MTRSSTSRRLAAGALSLCLTGTVLSTVATTAASGAQAAEPTDVHVWITKYHHIKMPAQIRPGMHRFVVRSARGSGFQLFKPGPGYTKREMSRDVSVMWEDPKALRRFERNVELFSGVNAQRGEPGVMWARVPVGHYWVLDTSADKFLPRKVFDLHVAGPRARGVLPGRATIRAVHEVDWAERPMAIPQGGRIVLRNNSTDNHFFGVSKLAKGKTMADFRDWVEAGADGRPPVNFDVGFDSGVVGPGRAMSLRYHLPRGRYVMTCWWPDEDHGSAPHVMMGMYRGIRVR